METPDDPNKKYLKDAKFDNFTYKEETNYLNTSFNSWSNIFIQLHIWFGSLYQNNRLIF